MTDSMNSDFTSSSRLVAESVTEPLPDIRLALPMAYGDPAFQSCLREAIETTELVEQFDRLYGATLVTRVSPINAMLDAATGKRDDDMRAFVKFVHDSIYLRLPADACTHCACPHYGLPSLWKRQLLLQPRTAVRTAKPSRQEARPNDIPE